MDCLDDLGTVVRVHGRQQAARLDAVLDDSRRQCRRFRTMRKPMCLLLPQSLDRISSRRCLRLEFLRERLRELRVSVSAATVGLCTLALRPVGRTVRHVVFGILLATERTQRRSFLFVSAGGRSEVVRGQLPEREVETRPRQTHAHERLVNNYYFFGPGGQTDPMTSYAALGAIFLTSSNNARISGTHGPCTTI